MILRNLQLLALANKTFLTSGQDSREAQAKLTNDLSWFDNYPHEVSYIYNSRGFRDQEWPESIEDLKRAIWCIGDSFTTGLAVNYQHTWPYILHEKTNNKTINVSMDGANNGWIADCACSIINEINPKNIVIHWSYTHRRQDDKPINILDGRMFFNNTTEEQDADFILDKIRQVENIKKSVNVIHSFIPKFHKTSLALQDRIFNTFPNATFIPEFEVIDVGRDLHHYGKVTAEKFVDNIIKLL